MSHCPSEDETELATERPTTTPNFVAKKGRFSSRSFFFVSSFSEEDLSQFERQLPVFAGGFCTEDLCGNEVSAFEK